MHNRLFFLRRNELTKSNTSIEHKKYDSKEDVTIKNTSSSKTVYAYINGKLVGEYDSITKCGNALGLTRLMVRKAIDQNVELEGGLKLSLNK